MNEKEIKIGFWFVRNRKKILSFLKKTILIILFFVLIGIFFNAFKYFQSIQNPPKINFFLKVSEFRERIKTKEIIIENSDFVPVYNQKGKYDLFAKIKNPNDRWEIKELTYQFKNENGEILAENQIPLLPNEERFIIETNIESPQTIKKVNFSFKNISFKRIKNPSLFPKIKFEIKEIRKEETRPFRIFAKIKNKSLFDLDKVEINVALFLGKKVIAVNQTFVENFLADQEKEIGFNWPEEIPFQVEVKIIPTANLTF